VGKEARLSFGAHALMDGRHGLCADLSVTLATESEPQAAVAMLERQRRQRHKPHTLAADRGYHCRGVIDWCRQHRVLPHVATLRNRQVPGLDGRTWCTKAYRRSQHVRRGVERIFGWCKGVGGLRKTRYRGLPRVTLHAQLVATAYNLLRIANLMPVPA
jgi:IS5 family transposase